MSYDKNNIFAKIIRSEIPCQKFYEDETLLAFSDINPLAPIHILLIPKGEYISFNDFSQKASSLEISHFFKIAGQIAKQVGASEEGYRIISNHGKSASQMVAHFHLHILAGKQLGGLLPDENDSI